MSSDINLPCCRIQHPMHKGPLCIWASPDLPDYSDLHRVYRETRRLAVKIVCRRLQSSDRNFLKYKKFGCRSQAWNRASSLYTQLPIRSGSDPWPISKRTA